MGLELFGSSGIRGVVNTYLTPALATKVGLALVTFTKAKTVLVATDTRVTGQLIENALISGILAGGANAESLGIVPTPALAFLTKQMKADAGVMITASHNPPQYNGMKLFHKDSLPYDERRQRQVERIVKQSAFSYSDWLSIAKASHTDKSQLYANMIQKKTRLREEWHVILDPGCGATFDLAPFIFKRLGCKVTTINSQPDGFFPTRSPEPTPESLNHSAILVRKLGADIGIAYDGDGDRVAFIDEKGNFADFDQTLAAYAAYVCRRAKNKVVVTNAEASMCMDRMVEAYGGEVIRTRVGDVHVSKAVKRNHAVFGGEPCGAWIHPTYHYCPDGILSSVLLLKALEDENKTLSELVSEVPQYYTFREKIPCENNAKYNIVRKLGNKIKKAFPDYRDFSTAEGVRLTLENGWILIRASGTEPLIRLTVEGESPKKAKQLLGTCIDLIRESERRRDQI